MASGCSASGSPPLPKTQPSRALDWVLLSLLLSHFCINCGTQRVFGVFDLERTAFLPGSKNGNYRASHVFELRRSAFSKAKIAYYPNSPATYSLMRIALSGDVELNPRMNTNIGTKTKYNVERRPCINIAHLNARSIKNRQHYLLARDLVKKYKLEEPFALL